MPSEPSSLLFLLLDPLETPGFRSGRSSVVGNDTESVRDPTVAPEDSGHGDGRDVFAPNSPMLIRALK